MPHGQGELRERLQINKVSLELLHRRLGHVGETNIKKMVREGLVDEVDESTIKNQTLNACPHCIQG